MVPSRAEALLQRSQLNNLQFSRLGAASDEATLRRLDSIAA